MELTSKTQDPEETGRNGFLGPGVSVVRGGDKWRRAGPRMIPSMLYALVLPT